MLNSLRDSVRPTPLEAWLVEDGNTDQRHDDREWLPKFSAKDSDEQAWRLARLARTHATVQQLFQTVESRLLPAQVITHLRDERGTLRVGLHSADWWPFLEPFFALAWRSERENPKKVQLIEE